MHRVVITGVGMSTSLGADLETCWTRLLNGERGVAPISLWDPSEYSVKVAAEVRHVPQESGLAGVPRNWCRRGVRLFLPVAREAFAGAQMDRRPIPSERVGVAVGASVNYLDMQLMKQYFRFRRPEREVLDVRRFATEGEQPAYDFHRRQGEMIASLPAKMLNITGPTFVTDTACASSAHAIGEAYRMVRRGQAQAMLAGGSAALVSPLCILGFSLLGALSRNPDAARASRPFDRRRDGFVMGEGAGAVVLEQLESAQARGSRIYAEVIGYGSTLSAHNLTDPSPDGCAEARAISLALAENSVAPEQVDYIAAHGTSTPKNDAVETRAIKRVFGGHARRLLVSSNKGQIGHTIAAAGVCNLICAVKALTERCAPPTMHLEHPDPECDLDYVANRKRPAGIQLALAHAFAFGGQNAVLALRTWPGDKKQ